MGCDEIKFILCNIMFSTKVRAKPNYYLFLSMTNLKSYLDLSVPVLSSTRKCLLLHPGSRKISVTFLMMAQRLTIAQVE